VLNEALEIIENPEMIKFDEIEKSLVETAKD